MLETVYRIVYHVILCIFFSPLVWLKKEEHTWGEKGSTKPVSRFYFTHTSRSSMYVQGKYTSSARFLHLHPGMWCDCFRKDPHCNHCVGASLFSQSFHRRKKMFFQAKLVQSDLSVYIYVKKYNKKGTLYRYQVSGIVQHFREVFL